MTKIRDSREFRDLAVQYANMERHMCVCVCDSDALPPKPQVPNHRFVKDLREKHHFIMYAFNGSRKQIYILSIPVHIFVHFRRKTNAYNQTNNRVVYVFMMLDALNGTLQVFNSGCKLIRGTDVLSI